MMDDLISRLSEIRSQYNLFNESEEPYYRALSEVIKMLSEQADGDTISRQDAIDYCYALINAENPSDPHDEWNYSQERINQTEVILHHLEFMPSAQPTIEPEPSQIARDIATIIRIRMSTRVITQSEKKTCKGCKHINKWEAEREYGFPSPCTGCKRIAPDNYEPDMRQEGGSE